MPWCSAWARSCWCSWPWSCGCITGAQTAGWSRKRTSRVTRSGKRAMPPATSSSRNHGLCKSPSPPGHFPKLYTCWPHRIDSFSLGWQIAASGDVATASPVAKPLWIFTSTTPNTTYAHREWRPRPGTQVALPGGPRHPGGDRWRSSSLSERQGSSSSSEGEKPLGSSPFPKPTGFLL